MHRLADGLALDDAGGDFLHRISEVGFDRAFAVHGLAKGIHDAPEHGFAHGDLQQFSKLHQMLDAVGRARHAIDDNHRIFRIDQEPRKLAQRPHFSLRRSALHIARDVKGVAVVAHELFLQTGVERDHHRLVWRRHREPIGAHHGLREMLQRDRLVVPLGEVANERVDVLSGVNRRHTRRTLGSIKVGAAHEEDSGAVAPGIVDRHGGVLQADGAVAEHHLRLAGDLEIGMRHRD